MQRRVRQGGVKDKSYQGRNSLFVNSINNEKMLKLASAQMNINIDDLREIVDAQWKQLEQWHTDPKGVKLNLSRIGTFSISRKALYNNIKLTIARCRKSYNEVSLGFLRSMLKFRHILNEYYSVKPIKLYDADLKQTYKQRITMGKYIPNVDDLRQTTSE